MNRQLLASAALALFLTACGGGSIATPATSTSTATTSSPSVSQSVSATGQTGGTPFAVPLSTAVASAAGIDASSFTLPTTLPANTAITANTGQPSNILTPFEDLRGTLGARSPESAGISAANALLYFVIVPPTTLTMSGSYQFSFTLHNTPLSATNYYIAAYNGAKWIANATGSAATVSGNTLLFSGTFPSTITLSANFPYAFVLYTLPVTISSTVTTATSGTSPTVTGLIDGSVSLTLPLSLSAVSIQYASSQILPQGLPNLALVSGVNKQIPGYITVTPTQTVTFPAGQSIVLKHPITANNGTNNQSRSGNGTSTGSSNSDTPYIAAYDPTSTIPTWALGFGTYASDGVTESLMYQLPISITLQANVTYGFAVYNKSS